MSSKLKRNLITEDGELDFQVLKFLTNEELIGLQIEIVKELAIVNRPDPLEN